MQDMRLPATRLRIGWRYRRELAKFDWTTISFDSEYWSPGCSDGGPWGIYDASISTMTTGKAVTSSSVMTVCSDGIDDDENGATDLSR